MTLGENADRDANRALRARFDEVYGQYQRLRSGVDDLQRKLAELRVTERSDDGRVTVVVGARGDLVSVDLDPAIYRDRDAKGLARTITETAQRAAAAAGKATRDLTAGYLPEDTGAAGFLRTGDLSALLGRADAALHREA
ncbi:YbaB/EbfC family nucleoid-associated protein [Micromonospora sp. NPDC047707]|uniref:YbaB/EbfC family nucleoid-associated protein n=1 Tax=Micromonospora sp. NPDC047707 TaxID=3154498 RepID=UPI00345126F0